MKFLSANEHRELPKKTWGRIPFFILVYLRKIKNPH